MAKKLKSALFYLVMAAVIFAGQFLYNGKRVTGTPPALAAVTLNDQPVPALLNKPPALIYFWAEWCGVCRVMQTTVSTLLGEYPGVTVALRSGDDGEVIRYLQKNQLNWPTVNDDSGQLANRYGVEAVPALFLVNSRGQIVFSAVGYTSIFGVKLRLWLAEFF